MTAPATPSPTAQQQAAVQAYFAEAATPTVIGTSAAGAQISATVDTGGKVLEQCGRSRRLLDAAGLSDPAFSQLASNLAQALDAASRDSAEIRRLSLLCAQHAALIDQ